MEKKMIWKKHCESLNLLSLGEVLRTMTFISYLLQQTDPSLRKKQIVCGHACVLSRVWFFTPLLTVAQQVPLSMGFSRQEYWGWVAISSPRGSFQPKIKPVSPASPVLGGGFFTTEPPGKTKKADRLKLKFSIYICNPTSVFLPGESLDGGAWSATSDRVAKNQTQLKWLSTYVCIH